MNIFNCQKRCCVPALNSSQRHSSSAHSWVADKNTRDISFSQCSPQSPHAFSCSPQQKVSRNRFPQEEVGVFLPVQHSVHFKGVGWGVRKGHHALAKFPERSLCHQLHPHWSDAAFDTERPVDGRVLLETDVQLEREERRRRTENEEFHDKEKTSCAMQPFASYYLVSLFLRKVSHTLQLYEDLVMRIWAAYWISYKTTVK